jgi:hypothetical protein
MQALTSQLLWKWEALEQALPLHPNSANACNRTGGSGSSRYPALLETNIYSWFLEQLKFFGAEQLSRLGVSFSSASQFH